MKRKSSKFLSLLLAAVLLLSLIAPAALAAGTADTIYLRTAEDLAGFSRNCTLDSWSQGKTVYLEADIDLTGVDFAPIPTFGGTFEGQGHTISGLSITGSGNVRGLFRYIQPPGSVRDLHVSGSISPADRKNVLGGLAGKNQGTITMCSFSGTVSGLDSIGGIAGINEAQGEIINCAFSGSVTGEHYVGGIAGQNYGSIIQCENSGSINTTEVDTELDLDALNREQLNAAENVPVCTDIGGIAGFSSGILQSCVNTGAVGYAHVGYNIGGIAGRQSGYLNGCTNSGMILGRKDVGGIAGQLVPEVRLLYNEGQVGDLLDELDVLRELIDQTGDDIRGTSDDDACRWFMSEYGLDYVILTGGSTFSTIISKNGESSTLATPHVEVVDTVGAGDSFSGTFTARTLLGDTLAEAHRKAVNTAAYVCTANGAWPEYPDTMPDYLAQAAQ